MGAEGGPQIPRHAGAGPPLRYAPVEMTIFLEDRIVRFQERSAELQIPRLRSG
jgi:hypothetical protein